MDNKNKGFTLVEIIITLAIIVTITTVAVGSYIGISNQKKKEEWRLVKDQIETAAEQYLSSNKYLYEEFDKETKLSAYIPVGILVEKDYLNKVTNPMDGSSLDSCELVKVEIEENGKYKGKYMGAPKDDECKNTKNDITFSEPRAAEIENNVEGDSAISDNSTLWYKDSVKFKLKIKTQKNNIANIMYCTEEIDSISDNTNSSCNPNKSLEVSKTDTEYEVLYNLDPGKAKKVKIVFMVTTSRGKKTKTYEYANIDHSTPTCVAKFANANRYGWTNQDAKVIAESCNDTGVGCNLSLNEDGYFGSETDGTSVSTKVYDKLGHSGSCSTIVRVDKTKPTFRVGLYKQTGETYTDNTWLSGYVNTIAEHASDNLSGIASYNYTTEGATGNSTNSGKSKYIEAEGSSTIQYKVCDKADNCSNSHNYSIKLDRTAPEGIIEIYSTKGSDYNSNIVNAYADGRDSLSGVNNIIIKANDGDKTNGNGGTYETPGAEYEKRLQSLNIPISGSLDGHEYKMKAVITDNAGNTGEIETKPYTVYEECGINNTTTIPVSYTDLASCSNYCGGGKANNTIRYQHNDDHTGKICHEDYGPTTQVDCGGTIKKGIGGYCSDTCGGTNWYIYQNYSTIDETTTCGEKEYVDQKTPCGGTVEDDVIEGDWGSCSVNKNSCTKKDGGKTISGTKKRTKTISLISSVDGHSCGNKTEEEEKTCKQRCPAKNEDPCDNMDDYVSISSSTSRTKGGTKTKSYPDYPNGKQSIVNFTFTISNDKISKVETHAAFCETYNTCKAVNSSNKNQTTVTCDESYTCYSGWEYVGASMKVSCGGKTKTYHYAHKIGTHDTWTDY